MALSPKSSQPCCYRFCTYILLFLFVLVIGCSSTTTTKTGVNVEDLDPGAVIKSQIELLIDAMAVPKISRMEKICERLINEYGELAIPELSKNIENRIYIVRVGCIYCLGKIYEKDKSKEILELRPRLAERLSDSVLSVRLEAACALFLMKDYRGAPLVIDALKNKRAYIRMNAAKALLDTFSLTFGYIYNDPDKSREKSVEQWNNWWLQNRKQYLASNS